MTPAACAPWARPPEQSHRTRRRFLLWRRISRTVSQHVGFLQSENRISSDLLQNCHFNTCDPLPLLNPTAVSPFRKKKKIKHEQSGGFREEKNEGETREVGICESVSTQQRSAGRLLATSTQNLFLKLAVPRYFCTLCAHTVFPTVLRGVRTGDVERADPVVAQAAWGCRGI